MMSEKEFNEIYRTRCNQFQRNRGSGYFLHPIPEDELNNMFINWFAKKYFLEKAYPFNTVDKVKHQINKIKLTKLIS